MGFPFFWLPWHNEAMSHYLHELVQVLTERKLQAYAQQSSRRVELIEARLEKLRLLYQFKAVTKACVSLWRPAADGIEILAFKHPLAGSQLVKGTQDPGELIEATALREFQEESGLQLQQLGPSLGSIHLLLPGGAHQTEPLELQTWHLFLEPAPVDLPGLAEQWLHQASGSPEEDGLSFDFFWQRLDKARQNTDFAMIFQMAMQLFKQHVEPALTEPDALEMEPLA